MLVLVTGATGFIGSHTVVALKQAGHQVRVLVRDANKAKRVFDNLGVTADDIHVGDVVNREQVNQAVEGCDAVIHSAAMVATAERYAEQVERTNVGGTRNIIDAALAAGVEKIIHVSSVTALFTAGLSHMDEQSPVGLAKTPYGRSKVACERYIRDLQAQGAPIIITYPAAVIGPHDPALTEPHKGLQVFLTKTAILTATGIQYIDVRDVAESHVQMLAQASAPDRYILGGHYFSWGELVTTLDQLTGRRLMRLPIPAQVLKPIGKLADWVINLTGEELTLTGEAMTYATQWVYADSSKLEKELSFRFRDRNRTLTDTIIWMCQAGHVKPRHIGHLAEAANVATAG